MEETDPSRYTRSKISDSELKHRVERLLKNVVGEVSVKGAANELAVESPTTRKRKAASAGSSDK